MSAQDAKPIRNVGLYIRYSCEEQRENSYSEEMQTDTCMEKLTATHGPGPYNVRVFRDLAVSGAVGLSTPDAPSKKGRQGLADLLEAIADGEVDAVLCYAQDRLSRDEYWWHFLNTMVFQRYKVPLLFGRDGHDVQTEEGRMVASFQAMVAATERRKISRNLKATAKRRAVEGYFGGTPPFGWQYDPTQHRRPRERHRLVRDPDQGIILMEIRTRYMAGEPTISIVRDLNGRGLCSPSGGTRWNTDMVLRALRNPVHAGLIGIKGELYPGQHAALRYWSPEEREATLERISERAHRLVKERGVQEFLLSGVVYCGHCGRRLVAGRRRGSDARTYRCQSPRTDGQHRTRQNGQCVEPRVCPGVGRPADELESAVVSAVADLAHSLSVQTAAREKLEQALDLADARIADEHAAVQAELAGVRDGFARLFGMLQAGRIDDGDFDAENQRRKEQERTLQERLDDLTQRLQQRQRRKDRFEAAIRLLSNFDALWETMSQAERRQLLLQVDGHMTLRREGDDMVLTISPGFADPIERVFVVRSKTPLADRRPDAKLSSRQMALLCCWEDGQSLADIAANWDIHLGTVRGVALTIRKLLGVDDLDEAAELVHERLERVRDTLPLTGRCQAKPPSQGTILSEPLQAVVQLMAEGKGCVEIAAALDKDKSTISRQMGQIRARLGTDSPEATVAKAKELGLLGRAK